MNKVLIIEPHRMLRQAMILTLVPEYEVHLRATFDNAESPTADLVIVDFAALHESGGNAAEILESIKHWRVPTVLIEGAEAAPVPDREGLVRLKSPVGKELLKTALAECIRLSSTGDGEIPETKPPSSEPLVVSEDRLKDEKRAIQAEPSVIELTDIVEENS